MTNDMATTAPPTVVELRSAGKKFGSGATAVEALRDVTVSFERGRFTAVRGPSGAGKTTLLQIAAGLEPASGGSVKIGDTELVGASTRSLDTVRRQQIGFVFQSYNLLPMLSVLENVVLPLRLRGQRVRHAEARQVLESVGLAGLASRLPSQLSGGQQQRAAIARSLLSRPEVIFADEPTGSLDQATGRQVLGLLRQAVDRDGRTLIMVTHDSRVAAWADRVIFIVDGRLHSEITQPTVENVTAELARWEV
jgi:putative ABC transport system ATP-binding protein